MQVTDDQQRQTRFNAPHCGFDWKRPRSVWLESTKPVFFDFGDDDVLLRLMVYNTYGDRVLRCVQYVSKQDVIESNGGIVIRRFA